jgi:hypothetical protein
MAGERHGRGMLCVNRPLGCQVALDGEFSILSATVLMTHNRTDKTAYDVATNVGFLT